MSDVAARLSRALADRYTIERELGAGGMATVYLAEDLKHKRKVAVKVLRPELAAVLGAERFVQEITTTANLQHPHILPLFDSGEADSFLYYVMPYIEGETLRDKLDREKQLGIEEAVKITTEVADALNYAHEQNVIHRDIKPENVLLQNGRPMVADFGIALAVSAAAGGRMTETGLSLGTPHYMSPEQATAERNITNCSDIYSLGAMLYEMLTGDPPHTGGTAQQIISKIVTEEPAPVTKVRKTVPPNVAAAVAKSLEKLPADRFGTATKFGEALADPSFSIAGAADRSDHGTTIWRRSLTTPALVFAGILLATNVWTWRARGGTPGDLQVRHLTLSLQDPKRQINDWGGGTSVVISPDGSKMAYHGPERIWWVRSFGELTATPIPESQGANLLGFSPGGDAVIFKRGGWAGTLEVRALSGESLETVADSAQSRFVWGHDGWIYYRTIESTLARIRADGSERQQLTKLDTTARERVHSWPFLLSNGAGLLFTAATANSDDVRIIALDLATRRRSELDLRGRRAWSVGGYLLILRADGTLVAAPFDERNLELTGPAVEILKGVYRDDLSVSRAGTLLYSTEGEGVADALAWVSRQGVVTSIDSSWTGRVRRPRLSMDGTRLAVSQFAPRLNVWVKNLESGSVTHLTFGPSIDSSPHWNAFDSVLMFVGPRPPEQRGWDVYEVNVDGGAAVLILDTQGDVDEAFVSPDGEWIIFMEQGDIFAMRRADLDERVVLSADPAFTETDAELSYDGRCLAYQSDESGTTEIYVKPFMSSRPNKQQVSLGGGRQAVWARNNRQLFYVSASRDLMVAEVASGASCAVGTRELLFSVANYRWSSGYDVTRDGQGFVFILGTEEAPGQVILVQNFFEELKEKVGN